MKGSRRDFLLGKSILDQLAGRASIPLHSKANPCESDADRQSYEAIGEDHVSRLELQASNYWEQYTKRAMACQFEILLNLHQYPLAAMAVGQAFDRIDTIEDQFTVYRDTSEVSLVNRIAALEAVVVEDQLWQILNLSQEIYQRTGGAFDITAAPLSNLWGFVKRTGRLPELKDIEATLKSIGSDKLKLDSELKAIQFLHPGVQINLGGIGKGFALDRVQQMLMERGINDFVVHGGQSSVVAVGSEKQTNSAGWKIGISHPILPQFRLAEIELRNQALGTSGSARQGFFADGKRYGHIIDPRTGWPSDRYLSATVLAPSAAVADALATAFFLMTSDQIADYCHQFPDTSAIMIAHPKSGQETTRTEEMLLQTFNLDLDQLNLLE